MKSTPLTISQVVKDGLCTGCGTCAALCPQRAISLPIDRKKGIYMPTLDETLCSGCGLCYAVCPGHEVDFKKLNEQVFGKQPEDPLLGNYIECYTGYANDHDIRFNSASGGLVTALLVYALEKKIIDGALVTGWSGNAPLEPRPFIARTRDEIISAARSKYCPVPANIALKEILELPGKYAVVGLPCHIHGIRKAEALIPCLKERIAMHLGIFCSNNNSFGMTDFILSKYRLTKENVASLEYRGQGWPGSMKLNLKNGTRTFIPYKSYIRFHELGWFTPRRCTLCKDTTAELSDLSFGDAWGIPQISQDNTGLSTIVSRSPPYKELIQEVAQVDIQIQHLDSIQAYGGNKLANLKAKLALNEFWRKSTPKYNVKFNTPRIAAYPYYCLLYLNSYISSKTGYWMVISCLDMLVRKVLGRKG